MSLLDTPATDTLLKRLLPDGKMTGNCRTQFVELLEHTLAMERELTQLRAENARLRDVLRAVEADKALLVKLFVKGRDLHHSAKSYLSRLDAGNPNCTADLWLHKLRDDVLTFTLAHAAALGPQPETRLDTNDNPPQRPPA